MDSLVGMGKILLFIVVAVAAVGVFTGLTLLFGDLAFYIFITLCFSCYAFNEEAQVRYQQQHPTGIPTLRHLLRGVMLWELLAAPLVFFIVVVGWPGWLAGGVVLIALGVGIWNVLTTAQAQGALQRQYRSVAQRQFLTQAAFRQGEMVQQTMAGIDRLSAAYLDGARRASRTLRTKGR